MKLVASCKALGGQLIERLNVFCSAMVDEPITPGSCVGAIVPRMRFEGSMVVLQVGAVDKGSLTGG